MKLDNFLVNLTNIALLINTILYCKFYFKNGKAYKIFTIYLVFHTLVEITMSVMSKLFHYNLFVSHLYFVGQFIILSFFYSTIILNPVIKKVINVYILLALTVLSIQYILNPKLFLIFNLLEIFITCFPLITYSVLYLYQMLNGKKEFYLINIGMIIYLFGSTIIFLSGNIINIYLKKFTYEIWNLNIILYFFYLILIFIEWKKNYSKPIATNELKS